ncbi:MAG: hypothetical protein U9R15_10470 [Chloroflexota bacterium]|nr:hypothetical protein [Chloroflexota bacterium]
MKVSPRFLLILILLILLLAGGVAVAAATGVEALAPLRLTTHFSWSVLADEADTMAECAECHETSKFHTCDTCHDDHGAIEMENVPFYAVIAFTGDVPDPGYVLVDDVLPYRDQPHTHVPLLDFLAEQGVTDFESVTLASRDEGLVTIERPNVTASALLMPYEDGIRFADESLHISTWLKGITRIVVVGTERPLKIDGQATSMGRLLMGPTRSVTVEQTNVMLKNEEDGQIREAKTAARVEGAPVEAIVANPNFDTLQVRDDSGQTHTLTAEESVGALLYQNRGQTILVLPERGRAQWIAGIVEINSVE